MIVTRMRHAPASKQLASESAQTHDNKEAGVLLVPLAGVRTPITNAINVAIAGGYETSVVRLMHVRQSHLIAGRWPRSAG